MRVKPIEDRFNPPPRALVLGTRALASRLVRDLEAEGFEAEAAESIAAKGFGFRLPNPSEPGAVEDLKRYLAAYLDWCGAGRATPSVYLHPGVSAWASRAELSLIGQELGISVMAPPPKVLSLFSNKLNLLNEAAEAGIPHLVLDFEPVRSVREIERLINQLIDAGDSRARLPIVLKSVRDVGTAVGVKVIQRMDDLERELPLWAEQLRSSLGEAIFFLERYVEGARRVEIPFARFSSGRTEFFPAVDTSLQYRQRKIIEFCPASGIEKEIETQLQEWTARLIDRVGYIGVGVLEFLVDGSRGYLVDGMPRLDSGFHLWESVAGTHAVSWQLAAMEGGEPRSVPVRAPRSEWGMGVAVRLYAEDSLLQLPQPGTVRELSERRHWKINTGEAELDMALESGEEVPLDSDGLLGVLWVGAAGRRQALAFARDVLSELWIAGSLQTNERFVSEILNHPWVREGVFHAGFVDEDFIPRIRPPEAWQKLILGVCAELVPEPGKGRWVLGDQWVSGGAAAEKAPWISQPQKWFESGRPGLSGVAAAPGPYDPDQPPGAEAEESRELRRAENVLSIQGESRRGIRVCAYPVADETWLVRVGNWTITLRHYPHLGRAANPYAGSGVRPVLALVSGRVHSLLYREGAMAPAHEPILVIEALQSLVPHALPADARVIKWLVKPESRVKAGQILAEVERSGGNV